MNVISALCYSSAISFYRLQDCSWRMLTRWAWYRLCNDQIYRNDPQYQNRCSSLLWWFPSKAPGCITAITFTPSQSEILKICTRCPAQRNIWQLAISTNTIQVSIISSILRSYIDIIGEKKAPVLTIFIGGNHEASNHLRELHFGGWAAPNIYFMGASNVLKLKKGNKTIRIGGLSGIFKPYDFHKGN